MKQPWVYMCSPSRSPLPPPSLPDPSRSSQCTRSKCLPPASNLGWRRLLIVPWEHACTRTRVCVCVCVWEWVAQSCPTLYNSMDCSLPGSSIHGIIFPWDSPGKDTGLDCHPHLWGESMYNKDQFKEFVLPVSVSPFLSLSLLPSFLSLFGHQLFSIWFSKFNPTIRKEASKSGWGAKTW